MVRQWKGMMGLAVLESGGKEKENGGRWRERKVGKSEKAFALRMFIQLSERGFQCWKPSRV